MTIYVMRHGIAAEPHEWRGSDSTRPLTPAGEERTEQVVRKLAKEGWIRPGKIWCSPLVRARQTAEIVSMATGVGIEIVDALACGCRLDDLLGAARQRGDAPERLMTVGHNPDCGSIIGGLCGDTRTDYSLKKAGIARLDGELKAGGMRLIWIKSPREVLGDDGRE